MLDPLDCAAGRGLLRAGLTDEGLDVVVLGIAAIWSGQALLPEEIVRDRPELAGEVFGSLAIAGRAELDEAGRLVGVHGFTLRRTHHRFVHEGTGHHTWCAFDSVGIPAAFGLDAVVMTDCPACGAALAVDIDAGSPRDKAPVNAEMALWIPAPEGTSHLMNQFCASADLYCSRGHLEERVDVASAPGQVLSLGEAAQLGRETWADVARPEIVPTGP